MWGEMVSYSCSCRHSCIVAAHNVAADDDFKEFRVGFQFHPVEVAHIHLVPWRKGCGLGCAGSSAGVHQKSSIVFKVGKDGRLEVGEGYYANNLGGSKPGQPDASAKLKEAAVDRWDGGGKPSRFSSEKPTRENPGCWPQHLTNVLLGVESLGGL